jgi:hypothetical protein
MVIVGVMLILSAFIRKFKVDCGRNKFLFYGTGRGGHLLREPFHPGRLYGGLARRRRSLRYGQEAL